MLERPLSEELNINERQKQQEIPEYTLGQRQDPPQFPQHYDDEKNDLLVECLQKMFSGLLPMELLAVKMEKNFHFLVLGLLLTLF